MGEFRFLHSLDLPKTVGNYTFRSFIGKGGYSEVYLVVDNRYNREYAAKVTFLDQGMNGDAIDAEINALCSLIHPHILKIYEYFHEGNRFVTILEVCTKGNIISEVEKRGKLSRERFLVVAFQALQALQCCHESRIAHRDIKPENLLVDQYDRIKLADFGLSVRTAVGLETEYCGTSAYQPPEIYNKTPYNPFKADIWSLGVTFVYLLNGCSPWRVDNYGAMKKHILEGRFYLIPSVDDDIRQIIKYMIVVEPSHRVDACHLLAMPCFVDAKPSSRLPGKGLRITSSNPTPPIFLSENENGIPGMLGSGRGTVPRALLPIRTRQRRSSFRHQTFNPTIVEFANEV